MNKKLESKVENILLNQYDRYYRLAYSYVQNEADALDIVQESAFRAIRDCHRVRNDAYLETWLYRIVINTSLELLRKQKREEIVEDVEPFGNVQSFSEDIQSLHSDWELADILKNLPPKERSLIILRYFEDMRLEDIAQISGENLNTIKARLYRTLRKLKRNLSQQTGRESGI